MESDINIDIEEGGAPLVEVKVCTYISTYLLKVVCTWTFYRNCVSFLRKHAYLHK